MCLFFCKDMISYVFAVELIFFFFLTRQATFWLIVQSEGYDKPQSQPIIPASYRLPESKRQQWNRPCRMAPALGVHDQRHEGAGGKGKHRNSYSSPPSIDKSAISNNNSGGIKDISRERHTSYAGDGSDGQKPVSASAANRPARYTIDGSPNRQLDFDNTRHHPSVDEAVSSTTYFKKVSVDLWYIIMLVYFIIPSAFFGLCLNWL